MNRFFVNMLREAVKDSEIAPLGSVALSIQTLDIVFQEMVNSGWLLDDMQKEKVIQMRKKMDKLGATLCEYCNADARCLELITQYFDSLKGDAVDEVAVRDFRAGFSRSEIVGFATRKKNLAKVRPENNAIVKNDLMHKIHTLTREVNDDLRGLFKDEMTEYAVGKSCVESGLEGRELSGAERRHLRMGMREMFAQYETDSPLGTLADECIMGVAINHKTDNGGSDFDRLDALSRSVVEEIHKATEASPHNRHYSAAIERYYLKSGKKGGANSFDDVKRIVIESGHPAYACAAARFTLAVENVIAATRIQEKLWEYTQAAPQVNDGKRGGISL